MNAKPESKTYKFKDSEYILLPLTFENLKYAAPLRVAFNKSFNIMMSDVDMSPVEDFKDKLAEIRRDAGKIERLINSGNLNKSVKAQKTKLLSKLKDKVRDTTIAFTRDPKVQALNRIQDSCIENAMLDAMSNIDIVMECVPLITKRTKGNDDLDFTALPEIMQFVKDVLTGFFSVSSLSSN